MDEQHLEKRSRSTSSKTTLYIYMFAIKRGSFQAAGESQSVRYQSHDHLTGRMPQVRDSATKRNIKIQHWNPWVFTSGSSQQSTLKGEARLDQASIGLFLPFLHALHAYLEHSTCIPTYQIIPIPSCIDPLEITGWTMNLSTHAYLMYAKVNIQNLESRLQSLTS